MENNYQERVDALTAEYKKSLAKKNLSKLKGFDINNYIAIRCVVISTNVQHYASSSVSGGGGGGVSYKGTGVTRNKRITSNTQHYVKNEAWVVSLENNSEFKLQLPSDFNVREGHTIILFGYSSTGSNNSFVLERYYNLATSQFSLESSGVFKMM